MPQRFYHLLLTVMALLSGASLAHGSDTPFPTDLTPAQKRDRPYVWIIFDQLPVYSEPDANKKTIRRLPFMKRVVMLAHEQTDMEYAAVAIVNDENEITDKIGWVERRWLLESPEAMKNKDRIHYKAMAITSVKAIQNDPDGEREDVFLSPDGKPAKGPDGKPAVIRKAIIYNSPIREKQFIRTTISLFNVLFIYAEVSGKELAKMQMIKAPRSRVLTIDETSAEAAVRAQTETYYLVGLTDRFMQTWEEDAAKQILGWIPKVRTELWDTREGVLPDRTSTFQKASPRRLDPLLAFLEPRDAYKWRETKADEHHVWREPQFDASGIGLDTPPHRLRFPLLRWTEDIKKDLKCPDSVVDPNVPKDPRTKKDGVNRLFRAGIFQGGRSNAAGIEIYTQEEKERDDAVLIELEQQLKKTELLFVIDDTASMDNWYLKVVPGVCEKILQEAKVGELSVGLTFYNDLQDGSKLDPDTAVDITLTKLQDVMAVDTPLAKLHGVRAHGEALIKAIKNHNSDPVQVAKRNGGGDAPEQVFRGLLTGIRKAGFEKERFARKIVILIGNFGNNDKFDKDENGKLKPTAPTVQKIAEALVPIRNASQPNPYSPIEFYAIQVIDPNGNYAQDDEKQAAPGFRDQNKEIIRIAQERLKATGWAGTPTRPGRSAGDYFHLENQEEVSKKIKEQYDQIKKMANLLSEQAYKIRTGLDGDWGEELSVILKLKNIDPERRIKGSGAQFFQAAFIWEYDRVGARQVRTQVLISDGELKKLLEILEELKKNDTDVLAAASRVVDTQAGDIAKLELAKLPPNKQNETELRLILQRLKEESINELVFKRMGLFVSSSPLLNATRGGLNELTGQNLYDVLHRIDLLNDIRKGIQVEYDDETIIFNGKPVTKYVPTKKEKSLDRRCTDFGAFGDGNSKSTWYWIDLDKEWP